MKDFKLNRFNIGEFVKALFELVVDDKSFRVNIVSWRDKRSLSQNSTYWMWLNEISNKQRVGDDYFDAETWHEYFKKHWCPVKTKLLPVGSVALKSTALLDAGEMHFYLTRIEQWAIDKMINVTIPATCEYRALQDLQNE